MKSNTKSTKKGEEKMKINVNSMKSARTPCKSLDFSASNGDFSVAPSMETAVEKAKEMRRRGKDMKYRLVEAQACKARPFQWLFKGVSTGFQRDFLVFSLFFASFSLDLHGFSTVF